MTRSFDHMDGNARILLGDSLDALSVGLGKYPRAASDDHVERAPVWQRLDDVPAVDAGIVSDEIVNDPEVRPEDAFPVVGSLQVHREPSRYRRWLPSFDDRRDKGVA
jgi:hypothetical protein